MNPRLAFLLLPYTRRELVNWDRLLKWANAGWEAGMQPRWKRRSKVVVRGKHHRFLMNLDLSDWCQRLTYFTGSYYEKSVLKTMGLILRPGDHFVDIGANIGMLTLHGRGLVGATGSVDSFEPNPASANAVREHLRINGITNVMLHQCALSDRPETLILNMTSEHSGTATLANVGVEAIASVVVEVQVADALIQKAPRLIKIDVEGFEYRVLRGLARTLATHHPYLIMEVIEEHLDKAGSSTRQVFDHLLPLGYEPYGIHSQRRRLRSRLMLRSLRDWNGRDTVPSDILWIPPKKNDIELAPYFPENI